ncbi:MAG TPA: BTAD domain-containing putative transcriptional regulator [Candidatus Dormibacteraeota bacterium]|nr:BTAD domain-containing putative transcriptional regulator [Candidatus Dormibacteraeota bacterium]
MIRLQLLGGFALSIEDSPVDIPTSSQRLLAVLALRDQALHRSHVSGLLWPDYGEERAAANLRTALCRLPLGPGVLVAVNRHQVALSPGVETDLHQVYGLVRRVFDHDADVLQLQFVRDELMVDLLPDWYEDWAIAEQERYNEFRLRALEQLCTGLLRAGRTAAAVDVGLAATAADPLRETAQSLLISSYLAEGNRAKAHWQFRKFRTQLRRELELEPSPALTKLMRERYID